jgi:hypothetical protein
MFVVRRFFSGFIRTFRVVKLANLRVYFTTLFLNSHARSKDRRAAFVHQFDGALCSARGFFATMTPTSVPMHQPDGFYRPSFEVFTITDQLFLRNSINGDRLAKFVKLFYRTPLKSILSEWRSQCFVNRYQRHASAELRFDLRSRLTHGGVYVCFHVWYRYVRTKRAKPIESTAMIPQWCHYLDLKTRTALRHQAAAEHRRLNIKKAASQALYDILIAARDRRDAAAEVDHFRLKRLMLFCVSAWAKYIIMQHSRVNTERTILRKWFGSIQKKLHLEHCLSLFAPRHGLFIKRRGFAAFVKNRRFSHVTAAYSYCKAQLKPSLALYFISCLRGDHYSAAICLAMHAWTHYYRRRKMWYMFVFENVRTTEYDVLKRKALAGFRRQRTPISRIPVSFIAQRFQQQTLLMYEQSMKSDPGKEHVFLLVSGPNGEQALQNAASAATNGQQRNFFFAAWRLLPPEPSLLMRIAVVNSARRRAHIDLAGRTTG